MVKQSLYFRTQCTKQNLFFLTGQQNQKKCHARTFSTSVSGLLRCCANNTEIQTHLVLVSRRRRRQGRHPWNTPVSSYTHRWRDSRVSHGTVPWVYVLELPSCAVLNPKESLMMTMFDVLRIIRGSSNSVFLRG